MPKKGYEDISDRAVRQGTGKDWQKWFDILDSYNAKEKGHRLTARHLRNNYRLSPWWSQVVTVRYEWERGLRR